MDKYNKDQLDITNVSLKIVYVVLRNDVRLNPKTKQRDDFTKVLWVYEEEDQANAYVAALRAKTPGLMTSFYVIPTPFGVAKTERGDQNDQN